MVKVVLIATNLSVEGGCTNIAAGFYKNYIKIFAGIRHKNAIKQIDKLIEQALISFVFSKSIPILILSIPNTDLYFYRLAYPLQYGVVCLHFYNDKQL